MKMLRQFGNKKIFLSLKKISSNCNKSFFGKLNEKCKVGGIKKEKRV